eukprot:6187539-Pleurochrysis_carterae.AAC.2
MLALKRSVTVLLVAHALLSVHAERSPTEVLQACAALKDMFNLRLIGPRFWCSHLHERQIECLESYMTPLAEHGQSGGETQYTPCEFDQATQKCSPGEPFYCATSPSPPPPARLGGGAPPAHDTHTAMDYLALSTALTLCAIGCACVRLRACVCACVGLHARTPPPVCACLSPRLRLPLLRPRPRLRLRQCETMRVRVRLPLRAPGVSVGVDCRGRGLSRVVVSVPLTQACA